MSEAVGARYTSVLLSFQVAHWCIAALIILIYSET